jgi:hypothetical protein
VQKLSPQRRFSHTVFSEPPPSGLSRDPDAAIVAVCGGELIASVIAGWDG